MAVSEEGGAATGHDLHELFRAVYRLHGVLEMGVDMVHEKSGMSTPWKRVLHIVDQGGNVTVPDIAAQLDVSRQFVLKTCNDMVEAGLVAYEANPRHKRSKLVRMTTAGEAAFRRTEQQERDIIARVLPGVDAHGARNAAALLDELRERMMTVGLEGVRTA